LQQTPSQPQHEASQSSSSASIPSEAFVIHPFPRVGVWLVAGFLPHPLLGLLLMLHGMLLQLLQLFLPPLPPPAAA